MSLPFAEMVAGTTFSDVQPEKALELANLMAKQSLLSFQGNLTYAAYKHIPCSFIYCENDMVIVPEKQQKFIDRIKTESGKEVDVHKLSTGHCPNSSSPDELVKTIVKIATIN